MGSPETMPNMPKRHAENQTETEVLRDIVANMRNLKKGDELTIKIGEHDNLYDLQISASNPDTHVHIAEPQDFRINIQQRETSQE